MDKARIEKSISDNDESDFESDSEDKSKPEEPEESAEHKSRACIAADKIRNENLPHRQGQKRKPAKTPVVVGKMKKLEITESSIIENAITGRYSTGRDFIMELTLKDFTKTLEIYNCCIGTLGDEVVTTSNEIEHIVFRNCNDNVYNIFKDQKIKLIHVHTDKFDGVPFKVTKLEATMITIGWYVGLKPDRVNFLEAQNGSIKHLTIHQLPFDFDGGEVLKYILNEMKLESFYYGQIPLILGGQKKDVKEFKATEIQITSAIEMLKQFRSIESFTLVISNTDISSDHIEKVLNSSGNVFNNLKEFVVIDKSKGSLGVFLGIFKNLRSLQKLTLITNNKFVNTILAYLPVTPTIKTSKYEKSCVNDANFSFEGSSGGNPLGMGNESSCSNFQRRDDDGEPPDGGYGGNDDDGDGRKDDDVSDEPTPQETQPAYPIITNKIENLPFSIQTSFNDVINDDLKLYVHAGGHAINILEEKNLDELYELIANEEFSKHITVFKPEAGKFIIEFKSIEGAQTPYPNEFKTKLEEIAYQKNKNHQLPLVPLIYNHPVTFKCDIRMEWNSFLAAIERDNPWLSASRWEANGSPSNGPFTIKADALSYYKIEMNGKKFEINGTTQSIEFTTNLYDQDAKALKALKKS